MRVPEWYRLLGLVAFLSVAGPSLAQSCAGFTDVPGSDPMCPNVQWLKNRSITAGCSTTTYCPAQSVTRLQMAAFMNRLGTAMTPVELGTVANDSMTPINIATPSVRCVDTVARFTVTGYPRRAVFNNKANLWQATGRVEVLAEAVFSTDGGVSWIAVPDSQTYQTLNGGLTPPDDVTTYQLGYMNLDVGPTYMFAVRVQSIAGTGNVRVYCVNRVQIVNRNGDGTAAAPFDEAYVQPGEDRTGRAAIPPVH